MNHDCQNKGEGLYSLSNSTNSALNAKLVNEQLLLTLISCQHCTDGASEKERWLIVIYLSLLCLDFVVWRKILTSTKYLGNKNMELISFSPLPKSPKYDQIVLKFNE